jgi:hypothetical protein
MSTEDASRFLATLVLAPGAGAAPTATVTISHQTRGCHSWALGSGPIRASPSVTVSAGTMLRFRNDDLMPHMLIQAAGPKLRLVREDHVLRLTVRVK